VAVEASRNRAAPKKMKNRDGRAREGICFMMDKLLEKRGE
jgi:hypothetical protein